MHLYLGYFSYKVLTKLQNYFPSHLLYPLSKDGSTFIDAECRCI